MSDTNKNKATIRKLYEQALNKRNMELLQDLISDNYTGPDGVSGATGFMNPINALINAFPNILWNLMELIGEDDKVVASWTVQGTHTGTFQGIPATGNKVSNTGIAIYTLKDSKIISVQVLTDRIAFLQQLEVIPPDTILLSNGNDRIRFIDKFLVPEKAKHEFLERMNINRNFIKKLPGFIEDTVYEQADENGDFTYITIAVWENEDSIQKAKEMVQAEYKRQGFDLPGMLERLGISMERGVYKKVD